MRFLEALGNPGSGYATASPIGYSPVGSEDSNKQAYSSFGKTQPTSAQKKGMGQKCPQCGAPSPGNKLCPKCKKNTKNPPTENNVDISSPA